MDGRSRKVLEDKDEVEVLEAVLDALEVRNFDLGEREDEERRLGEEHERVGRRLEEDVGPERDALEAELAEGDVDLDPAARLRAGEEEGGDECREEREGNRERGREARQPARSSQRSGREEREGRTASAILSENALKYLLRSMRRLRSSCSASSSSSSW